MRHRFAGASARLALGVLFLAVAWLPVSAHEQRLSAVHDTYADPDLPFDHEEGEVPPDDSLAAAIAETFTSNPGLAAQRYDLRATDDEIGITLSGIRPTAQMQVSGNYDYVLPGSITQAGRPLSDRLNDPHIQRDNVATQLVVEQPITTGGRCSDGSTWSRLLPEH